jgi:MFS transporter, DHA1 family, multidrug resistance protein
MSESSFPAAAPQGKPSPHTPSHWRMGLVLGSLTAFGPLAIDTYLPSFPAISRDLGVEASSVQATVAVYFLGLALGQSFYGPVADRRGRKGPLYAGLLLFILASAGCALTRSIGALIALRFLQALGGSAQIVVARAVVRDYFDERDSARVLSLLMLVMGVAPILAPLLGGQLVGLFGWRSIFWTLAAFATACLVAVSFTLPESLPPERRLRQSSATVLRLYGSLLANRQFMAPVLAGSLISAGMFAYIAGSPFVFMAIFGVSPAHFGLFFGSNALGLIAASQINARLVRRIAPARILTVVLIVTAGAGLVLLGTGATGIGGFPGLLVPLFLFVASLGFVAPNATALAMGPQGRNAGSASALLGVTQFLCGGISGGLVSALYDGTPVPMVLVIALCGIGACGIHLRFGRRR